MRRILKWIGIVVGGLVGLILIVAVVLSTLGRNRLNNAPEVAVQTVALSGDAAHGKHLVENVAACVACHGKQFEGGPFIDEPPIGYVPAPNLTSTHIDYTDEDWARAIRHGVAGDGRVMAAMPSTHYQNMSDQDLADIIAYMKTVPPAADEYGVRQLSFTGNIIFGNMAFGTLPVNVIEHENVGGRVAVAESAEYGEYLATVGSCKECHGPALDGVTLDPNAPQGPTLASVAGWSDAEFITAMRTGVTPSGKQLSEEMPFSYYAGQTDEELRAMWMFLRTLDG